MGALTNRAGHRKVLHMQDSVPDPRIHEAPLGGLIAGVRSRLVQVAQARVAEHGLTAQQFWMLMVLHEQGSQCLRALADQLWCDEPTASRVLKSLMKGAWVQVGPDPDHGRRLRISVAEGARTKVLALHDEAKALRQGVKAGFTPQEEAELRTLLARMLQNLDRLDEAKG